MLHLGLDEFLTSKPVHIIAPIGVTFLWQRATQIRASSKRPYVESSSGVASPPLPSSGDPTAEEYIDLTAVVDLPPSTSGDSSIQSMLDIIMIV